MVVLDTQLHLPTDMEKGEQLGYDQPNPAPWAEQVNASFEDRYGDEQYAVIPTVTGREWENYDAFYESALTDFDVMYPTRAVELQDPADVTIIGRYDPSFFDYDVSHGEDENRRFVDALVEHTDEYGNAVLLDHPFSTDGGILRDERPESPVYETLVDAAFDHDVYTDQYGNAWVETFRDAPWRWMNAAADDRFGFEQEWDIQRTSDGYIRNVGSSDAKDAALAGQGVSRNASYDTLADLDDVTTFLNDEGTVVDVTPVLAGSMVRKIGDGIGPVRSLHGQLFGR